MFAARLTSFSPCPQRLSSLAVEQLPHYLASLVSGYRPLSGLYRIFGVFGIGLYQKVRPIFSHLGWIVQVQVNFLFPLWTMILSAFGEIPKYAAASFVDNHFVSFPFLSCFLVKNITLPLTFERSFCGLFSIFFLAAVSFPIGRTFILFLLKAPPPSEIMELFPALGSHGNCRIFGLGTGRFHGSSSLGIGKAP